MSRHMNTGRKLSRNTSHRRALLDNLVRSVILSESIRTTTGKAKEARQAEEGKEEGRTRKAVVLLFPLPAFQCQRGGLKDHRGDAEGAEMLGFEKLTERIIGAAIEVHREVGPGLLESSYAACMRHELTCRGLRFEHEKAIPITYKGLLLDAAYRIDLLVEDRVVVELKSVERLERIHDA